MATPAGIYLDSALIVKFYATEVGSEDVRALVRRLGPVTSSAIAVAEVSAAFHRKLREGSVARKTFEALHGQFSLDQAAELWRLVPVSEVTLDAVRELFATIDAKTYLRSADAIHLVSARNEGFSAVYSNDRHLLSACGLLGMNGINPIGCAFQRSDFSITR